MNDFKKQFYLKVYGGMSKDEFQRLASSFENTHIDFLNKIILEWCDSTIRSKNLQTYIGRQDSRVEKLQNKVIEEFMVDYMISTFIPFIRESIFEWRDSSEPTKNAIYQYEFGDFSSYCNNILDNFNQNKHALKLYRNKKIMEFPIVLKNLNILCSDLSLIDSISTSKFQYIIELFPTESLEDLSHFNQINKLIGILEYSTLATDNNNNIKFDRKSKIEILKTYIQTCETCK